MAILEKLIDDFIAFSIDYSNAINEGNSRKANKANARLKSIYNKINSQDGNDLLKDYLGHENDEVRLCVASFLIHVYTEPSILVLKNISKNNSV